MGNQLKFFFLFVFLIKIVSAIDIKGARERQCFKISKTVQMSPEFLQYANDNKLYYPLMSRLDLYYVTLDLARLPPKEINEGAIYYDGCITANIFANGSLITVRGFGNSRSYSVNPIAGKPGVSYLQPVENKKGFSLAGKLYPIFTDNKSFVLFTFCFEDGEMAWFVLSTIPKLEKEKEEQIKKQVITLGFKQAYFTQQRYNQCSF